MILNLYPTLENSPCSKVHDKNYISKICYDCAII